ncbi:helix-turn-helix transcriptional regulator [Motilibacter sp. E257]|uniref:Helix-turn-helix transcriptional regulator n=1 Tax=Motilibacter deserti TaxID=2714956 RepID=A0ABX0GTT1_9ACTN|nr:helix-turn-helix transcriptional regulator [Motilibacter deserti]NHC13111.1 helix-turn-helix transcriptional regulator [Motilibacter deserti]
MILLRRLLGATLRRARHEQGKTLRDVAAAADVSIGYLSEIERGRKEPSSEVVAAVCAALGLSLSDLLGELHGQVQVLELRSSAQRAPVQALRPLPPYARPGAPTEASLLAA